MFVVSIRDVQVREPVTTSSKTLTYTFELDRVATAPVTVFYYLQDGNAINRLNDFDMASGSVTVAAGQQQVSISLNIDRDTLIEGNETFQLVAIAGNNAVLQGNAAALVSTINILDANDGVADGPDGTLGLATPFYGSAAADPVLPTLSVRSVAVGEGNLSYGTGRFLVTLDKPATSPVTFRYYLQDKTAGERSGDYDARVGTVTIPAGQQSNWIDFYVNGDTLIEGNEQLELVVWGAENAVLSGNAPALRATATIVDDDSAVVGQGGFGAFAAPIDGPPAASLSLPTIRVHDVSAFEGNSSYGEMRFLITLDRAATAPVTIDFTTLQGTAASTPGTGGLSDFDSGASSVTIAAGQKSTWIRVYHNGDTAIEGDEHFNLLLTNARGAVFEGNAAALVARGTIIDNDDASADSPAGLGAPARQIFGPADTSSLPIVKVVPAAVFEGNSSYQTVPILIMLSKAATVDLTFSYRTIDATAQSNGDFYSVTRSMTIPAGSLSAYAIADVNGDVAIEGDETFSVEFFGLQNALFENGLATTTTSFVIVDDDTGQTAGRDLSPLLAHVQNGTNGEDTLAGSPLGDQLNGFGGNDVLIGGAGGDRLDGGAGHDSVRYDQSSSGVTANLVWNMGSGGDAAGDVYVSIEGVVGSSHADVFVGSDVGNVFSGEAGNDTVWGGNGADQIWGGAGDDVLLAAGGDDSLDGGTGSDTLIGGDGADILYGGDGAVRDYLFSNFGNDLLYGGAGDDIFDLRYDLKANEFDTLVDFQDFQNGAATNDYIALPAAFQSYAVIWQPTGTITQIAIPLAGGNYMVNIIGTSAANVSDQIIWV